MKAVVVPDVVDGSINVTDVPVPEVWQTPEYSSFTSA